MISVGFGTDSNFPIAVSIHNLETGAVIVEEITTEYAIQFAKYLLELSALANQPEIEK